MKRTEEQSHNTRDAILDTAIDLFVRDGFDSTSMDSIAAAANVAKGTLYYHYDSKEGILDAILERYARDMESRLSAVEAQSLEPAEKLRAFVATMAEVNEATFTKLHHVKHIDIHFKTGAIIMTRFSPYLARLITALSGGSAEYPLELAEILLAAGQALFEPEAGVERLPRRATAIAKLCAAALGKDERTMQWIFEPLTAEGKE